MSNEHVQWLAQQLPKLVSSEVIDAQAEQRLLAHYKIDKLDSASSVSIITIILAAIGGLLIGGGIILIFAHNWENFGRPMRAVLAFTPLVVAQVLTLMALFPKRRGQAWREIAGALMFCAVPTSIALIGQTYHISDDTQAFLTWWFVLVLPFVYLLRSHLTAILMMLLGATLVASYHSPYWLCLLVLAPYCYFDKWPLHAGGSVRNDLQGIKTPSLQLRWILALCIAFTMPQILFEQENTQYFAMMLTAGAALMYLLGGNIETVNRFGAKPFTNIGAVALSINGLAFTYRDTWPDLNRFKVAAADPVWHHSLFQGLLVIAAIALLVLTIKRKRYWLLPMASIFVLTSVLTLMPHHLWSPTIYASIFNVVMVLLGFWYVYLGVQTMSTSQLNFGLLLVMGLVMMRFFDQDLSFVARGIAFIAMGSTLIAINVWHGRRRVQA